MIENEENYKLDKNAKSDIEKYNRYFSGRPRTVFC